jgi:hypothetical protein
VSKKEITSHHIYGTDIQEIVERMKEITIEIEGRAKALGMKKGLVLRADPQIKRLWRKLCVLHMRGLVVCEETGYNTEACMFIKEPQACQKILEIPREETCCGRFFGLE